MSDQPQEPPGVVVAATDPSLPTDVLAFIRATGAMMLPATDWTAIADIPGGGISFPAVLKDAAYTYVLGQIGGNFLSICKLQGTALIAAWIVPSPGTLRSGAFGGAGGEVYSDFHGEGHTALLMRYLIPGWQEPQPGPGPGPGPGGDYVTRAEYTAKVTQLEARIAALEAQGGGNVRLTQEDANLILNTLDAAIRDGNAGLNRHLFNLIVAVLSRQQGQDAIKAAAGAALTGDALTTAFWQEPFASRFRKLLKDAEYEMGAENHLWGLDGQTTAGPTGEHTNADETAGR